MPTDTALTLAPTMLVGAEATVSSSTSIVTGVSCLAAIALVGYQLL
jgi:hypothetical protein